MMPLISWALSGLALATMNFISLPRSSPSLAPRSVAARTPEGSPLGGHSPTRYRWPAGILPFGSRSGGGWVSRDQRLLVEDLGDAMLGQAQQLVQFLTGERSPLGRSLHLDEPAR